MCAALVLGAPRGGAAELLQPSRKPVAHALELTEIEQARAAVGLARSDSPGGARHERLAGAEIRKGVGEDARDVLLEPRDLCLQRAPGGPLGRARALRAARSEIPWERPIGPLSASVG